jgi:hypothetical protein
VLYIVTLKKDGTVKNALEINPACAESEGGALAPLGSTDNVPDGDRLCRSMAFLGNVFGDTGSFTVLCGAGASGGNAGDLWMFALKDSGSLTTKCECGCATALQTCTVDEDCSPKASVLAIVLCCAGGLLFLGLAWYCCKRCRRRADKDEHIDLSANQAEAAPTSEVQLKST